MPRLKNATHFVVTYVHIFTYITNYKHENLSWFADWQSMVYEEIWIFKSMERSLGLTTINPVHTLTHLCDIIFGVVSLVTKHEIAVLFVVRACVRVCVSMPAFWTCWPIFTKFDTHLKFCSFYFPTISRPEITWWTYGYILPFQVFLTLRRLMSYIYGAPILDVSRSHTTTQHSR